VLVKLEFSRQIAILGQQCLRPRSWRSPDPDRASAVMPVVAQAARMAAASVDLPAPLGTTKTMTWGGFDIFI
jgi:hypothetical protein